MKKSFSVSPYIATTSPGFKLFAKSSPIFSVSSTEAEREALIRGTLNGLYDDAAKAYEETAKDILDANAAQGLLNDKLAAAGAVAAPLTSIFKVGLAGALDAILPGLEEFGAGLTDMVKGVQGGSEKVKNGISSMVNGALGVITETLPTLLTVGVSIIQSLLEGVIGALPSLLETIMNLIPQIVEMILTLLPQLVNTGVSLIVSLLEGISTMLPELLIASTISGSFIISPVRLISERNVFSVKIVEFIEIAFTLLGTADK